MKKSTAALQLKEIWTRRSEKEREYHDMQRILKDEAASLKPSLLHLLRHSHRLPRDMAAVIFDALNRDGQYTLKVSAINLGMYLGDLEVLRKKWGLRIDTTPPQKGVVSIQILPP